MATIDSKKAREDIKPIENQIESLYKAIKEILLDRFPHLYFYISPEGYISCWVRTLRGDDGAGIHLKYKINVGQMLWYHWEYLDELNDSVEQAHLHPSEYFYCTECGRVLPKEEFEENVFAGYYCKECAKKPGIAKLIAKSHERGFYD